MCGRGGGGGWGGGVERENWFKNDRQIVVSLSIRQVGCSLITGSPSLGLCKKKLSPSLHR